MRVSINWLQELVDLKVPVEELIRLLPLRTIAVKDTTKDYIELDMKGYNRADLLSLRGVAYEIAAITNSQIKFEDLNISESELPKNSSEKIKPPVKTVVENPDDCLLYFLVRIEGLTIEPAPLGWQAKLENSGIRSINNVTDVTNLVMLEYGQPLHAFNSSYVKDQTIIVRSAKAGEKLTTLDQKNRSLEPGDILITDQEKILGLGGIMGGKDSEIPDSGEVTVLLEAAIFNPIQIRKTAARLALQSEASKRFYHGLTKRRLIKALDVALRMYQQLGGQVTTISRTGKIEDEPLPTIKLSSEKINQLIGIEVTANEVEGYLKKLHFNLEPNTEGWIVTPPYWRLDISIEEDLIEEIARMYGYEKIPANPLKGELPSKIDQSLFETTSKIKNKLVDLGLTELQTYSFFSTRVLTSLGWDKQPKLLVKIANPISKETEYLRMNIWPNLVEVIAKNREFEDVGIFEFGKVFNPIAGDKPKESYVLSIALSNLTDNPLAELYQIAQKLFEQINPSIKISREKPPVEIPLFHPNRLLPVMLGDKRIGAVGEVHPRILDKFGIQKRVAVLEIDLEELIKVESGI